MKLPGGAGTAGRAVHPVRAASVLLVGLAAAVLSACGGGTGRAQGAPGTTTTGPPALSGPTLQEIAGSSHVTINGRPVAVPTEHGGRPITPVVDDGQAVIISAKGFLPARLFSSPGVPVTWTNLTDQSQRLVFDHLRVTSTVIPPGGSWSWTSVNSQSISYHSLSGLHGVVTVNPRFLSTSARQ